VLQQREGTKNFRKIRKWHAGVESRIHVLKNGDKGVIAYERYIASAVMGRYLQTLVTVLPKSVKNEKKKTRSNI
jgi:hypothetical protein